MSAKRNLEPDDLYRLRLISDAQIAPDGSRVAFVLKTIDRDKNDYLSNIYVVTCDGAVSQFTAGNKDSAPRWSPDGRYLAFLSGRKERAQLYLLRTDGGEAAPLTDLPQGAGVPFWSPDSRRLAFTGQVSTEPEEEETAGEKEPKPPARTKITGRTGYKLDGAGYTGNRRRHIFVVPVDGGEPVQLTQGDNQNDNPAWSPDGLHLAFNSNRDPMWDVSPESHIFVIPAEGGEARQLTSGGAFSFPRFSPDGSRIAFVGNANPNEGFTPSSIFSIARDGSDRREETAGWDANVGYQLLSDVVASDAPIDLVWRDDGICFLGSARGESDVYSAADGTVQHVTEGRHAVTSFSFSADGTLAVSRATATTPCEIVLLERGKERQLTHENDAFLEEVEIRQPERLAYPGADGEEGDAWILPPREAEHGKHPLIVYIHGGPMLAYGELLFFEYQFLAGRGFGVFFPNIHGSATYGREYQTSITGDWGNRDYQDVMQGTDRALEYPWVDVSRLGIIGGSYGGFMTGWVMGHSDRFKAGVTERCLANWISFFGTSDGGWAWNRVTGAYPEEDVLKLWEMSPVRYVPNVSAPLLVMQYEGDDRTPLGQGEEMFNALRRNGKETKLIVFPEESHGMTRIGKPSRRIERMHHIVAWFTERL